MIAGEVEERRQTAPAAQPGGRRPAPGRLALVQEFINTHYDLETEHGAEVLHSPAAAAQWLFSRRLLSGPPARPPARPSARPPSGPSARPPRGPSAPPRLRKADLDRLLAARESLRSLARANAGVPVDRRALAALNAAAQGASVEIRFASAGPVFVPGRDSGSGAAIGFLLATTAAAMIDGTWARLKICPGQDCGWAFYDHSRNQTGRWCSMSVCGGRAKAKAHYRRQRGG